MVAFPLAINQNEAVTGGTAWPLVEGESTHVVTWPLLHGNANNCGMAFEDNFMSNMTINKDIVPMQHLSMNKTCVEAKLLLRYARIWARTSWT